MLLIRKYIPIFLLLLSCLLISSCSTFIPGKTNIAEKAEIRQLNAGSSSLETTQGVQYFSETPLKKHIKLKDRSNTVTISGKVKIKNDSAAVIPPRKIIALLNVKNQQSIKVAGFAYSKKLKQLFTYIQADKDGKFSLTFKIPNDTKDLELSLRTFYFKKTIAITDFKIEQSFSASKNDSKKASLNLQAMKWYLFTGKVHIDEKDLQNENPLFCIRFSFLNQFDRMNPDGTYLGIAADGKNAYKYIFAEDLKRCDDGSYEYRFQFKTPDNLKQTSIFLSGWKNKHPVRIGNFTIREHKQDVQYFTETPIRKRLLLNGFSKSVEISGKIKIKDKRNTTIPPRKIIALLNMTDSIQKPLKISNIAYSSVFNQQFVYITPDKDGNFSQVFKLPHNAAEIMVALRTFYFKEIIEVSDFKIKQSFTPLKVVQKNDIFEKDIAGGTSITLKGHIKDNAGSIQPKSAFMQVKLLDKDGKSLPCPGFQYNKNLKYHYAYLPQKNHQEKFHFQFTAPEEARKIQIHIARFYNKKDLTLLDFEIEERISPLKFRLRKAGIILSPGFMEDEKILDQILEYLMPGINLDMILKEKTYPFLTTPIGHGYIYDYKSEQDLNKICLRDFRPFDMPENLTWEENPYKHSTWQQKFYTLHWAVLNDQAREDAEYIKKIMKSFFKRTPFVYHKHPMCYEDHAISCRLESMLALYHGVEKNANILSFLTFNGIRSKKDYLIKDKFFMKQYFVQMLIDAENLFDLLHTKSLGIHNHNLFMAHALLSFSLAFPQIPKAGVYKKIAMETIASHLSQMYEIDNITAEQSAAYQHTFLMYFLELYCWLQEHNLADTQFLAYLQTKVEKILAADKDFILYNGEFFSMGDTVATTEALNELHTMINLLEKSGRNPEKSQIKDDKKDKNVSFYPESGIYIFTYPQKNRKLLIDISANQKVHGHFDQGNWLLYAGRSVITDGGGPYRYGSKKYRKLMSSNSHNIATIDGISQMAGETSKLLCREEKDCYILSFDSNVYGPDYTYHRVFIVRKDLSKIAIKDSFMPNTAMKILPACSANVIISYNESGNLVRNNDRWLINSKQFPENQVSIKFSGNSRAPAVKKIKTSMMINRLDENKYLNVPFEFGKELVTEIFINDVSIKK